MEQEKQLIEQAVGGDRKALETLLCGVQDTVFNLALRMLGMISDAEDATQEILIQVMTHLASMQPCEYEELTGCMDAMEELDAQSQIFADLPAYRVTERTSAWIRELMASGSFSRILQTQGAAQ